MRGLQAQYKCVSCAGFFSARVADRKRGWAQYCSKACKQITQEAKKKVWKILGG